MLTALSKAEGLCFASSFVTAAYFYVRLIPQDLGALHLGLFSLPSDLDFLPNHHSYLSHLSSLMGSFLVFDGIRPVRPRQGFGVRSADRPAFEDRVKKSSSGSTLSLRPERLDMSSTLRLHSVRATRHELVEGSSTCLKPRASCRLQAGESKG
jgi:hypothetical protein